MTRKGKKKTTAKSREKSRKYFEKMAKWNDLRALVELREQGLLVGRK